MEAAGKSSSRGILQTKNRLALQSATHLVEQYRSTHYSPPKNMLQSQYMGSSNELVLVVSRVPRLEVDKSTEELHTTSSQKEGVVYLTSPGGSTTKKRARGTQRDQGRSLPAR